MGTIGNPRDYLILTNNPLVPACMEGKGLYTIDFRPELSFREVLVLARDKVYAGHTLYTHPLAGSVKPNETPYKSILVGKTTGKMDPQDASIIENSIITADKFSVKFPNMPQSVREDFQLIDSTLIRSALSSIPDVF